MGVKTTDTLGRATFHSSQRQEIVRPTTREIIWLKHIERHGPQASTYLYELTKDTHRCKDTALRQMQKLRTGGYLFLPKQQRQTEHADFNPYIYDLTATAEVFLKDRTLAEPTVRPTGHWWHSYLTSCVTSSIEIMAHQRGVRFIPTHELLAIQDATLGIAVGKTKLIPDQFFALDYGGTYRLFMLEVDCGTEPLTSGAARKSLSRSVQQYEQIIRSESYKGHYGLKSNLLILWVFLSKARQESFLRLLEKADRKLKAVTLCTDAQRVEIPKAVQRNFFDGPWSRSTFPAVTINV